MSGPCSQWLQLSTPSSGAFSASTQSPKSSFLTTADFRPAPSAQRSSCARETSAPPCLEIPTMTLPRGRNTRIRSSAAIPSSDSSGRSTVRMRSTRLSAYGRRSNGPFSITSRSMPKPSSPAASRPAATASSPGSNTCTRKPLASASASGRSESAPPNTQQTPRDVPAIATRCSARFPALSSPIAPPAATTAITAIKQSSTLFIFKLLFVIQCHAPVHAGLSQCCSLRRCSRVCSAAVSAAVAKASRLRTRGRDALNTAGKMPALHSSAQSMPALSEPYYGLSQSPVQLGTNEPTASRESRTWDE